MENKLENILTRRSIRHYKNEPVPQELLDQIITAGTYAASGRGLQDTIIIQVTNPQIRAQLAALNAEIGGQKPGFDPFYGAPAILIVLAEKERANHIYDGSLVMGNLMQAAHQLGLGSCWIHRARQEFELPWGQELLKSLGITGSYEGIGHCALGYIDGNYTSAPEIKPNRVFYIR